MARLSAKVLWSVRWYVRRSMAKARTAVRATTASARGRPYIMSVSPMVHRASSSRTTAPCRWTMHFPSRTTWKRLCSGLSPSAQMVSPGRYVRRSK